MTTGNYVGLKILLESSVLFGSFNEKKNTFVKGLNRDVKDALCIDVFAQDTFGKSARDYSHKIVFMSKLLCKAEIRQVKDRCSSPMETNSLDYKHGLIGSFPHVSHNCLSRAFIRS